jgi:hypothetical protein
LSYHSTKWELAARPIGRAKDPLIEPNWWELPAILALTALLAAADIGDWRAEDTLNIVAPLWLSLALGASALKMAVTDNRAIWAPLFWFRVATLIYFGFGDIAPLIMNSASLIHAQSTYFFLPTDVQKVNLIAAAGVACVLSGNLVVERLFVPAGASGVACSAPRAPRAPGEAARFGTALFLIGAAINYFILMPYTLGLTDFVVPGFVVNLASFEYVGFSLLTIWAFAHSWTAVLAVAALVAVESMVGLLMLNKTGTLLPWISFVIGALSYKLTIPRLAAAGLLLSIAFSILQPLVGYGRNEAFNNPANKGGEFSFSKNLEYFRAYFDDNQATSDPEALQGSLLRVSFIDAATFVIAQYDHGLPGNSLREALYVFIPRFLWPEKPVVMVGAELATLVSGEVGNQISAGYFAESYWNFGWIGLPLLLFPVGVFFNVTTHFAARVIEREDWLYLPVLFISLKVGMQIDAWYNGFVAGAAQGFALYLILKFGGQLLRSLGLVRPSEGGA